MRLFTRHYNSLQIIGNQSKLNQASNKPRPCKKYQDNSDRSSRQIGRINCDVHVSVQKLIHQPIGVQCQFGRMQPNQLIEQRKSDRRNIAWEELIQRLWQLSPSRFEANTNSDGAQGNRTDRQRKSDERKVLLCV